MPNSLPITIKGKDAFPIDVTDEFFSQLSQADRVQFKETVETTVADILDEYGIKTEEDVTKLPLDKWSELRERLLAVKTTGSTLHE